MNSETLHSAVRSEKLASKQGLLQKLFTVWFDAFVYNQIWEDPRVDLQALQLNESSRVLTISSGGCNALNYLLEGPRSVTAVDLNRHHIYLLNFKLAALQHLPRYEEFFEFFGRGRSRNAGANYLRYIALYLDRDTRTFWESNTIGGSILFGDRISFFTGRGLYDHSRNGYFLRFFHKLAQLSGFDIEQILAARTHEEQQRIFKENIDPFFDTFFIRVIGRLPITMFGLGIPPQQFDELANDLPEGKTIIDTYRERVRRLACDFPTEENYFAWQAFARKYDTQNRRAIPDYLKEENYDKLKAYADRLTTILGSVTDVIANSVDGAFNRFVFLDAQDWMNARQIAELWSAVAEKAEPGSRIIFRTAGSASPVETNLPTELRARFVYYPEVSRQMFKQDRASIYGGFHLYSLKN